MAFGWRLESLAICREDAHSGRRVVLNGKVEQGLVLNLARVPRRQALDLLDLHREEAHDGGTMAGELITRAVEVDLRDAPEGEVLRKEPTPLEVFKVAEVVARAGLGLAPGTVRGRRCWPWKMP